MPTSGDVRPLTNEQTVRLRRDLTLIEERLQDIAVLMRVCYGGDSQPAIRADETAAALQRLKWELERTKLKAQAAGIQAIRQRGGNDLRNRVSSEDQEGGSSRQGCESSGVKVPVPSITCFGRLAYPGHAEVTKHDVLGRRSHCPPCRDLQWWERPEWQAN
jgi:hypothetical protein